MSKLYITEDFKMHKMTKKKQLFGHMLLVWKSNASACMNLFYQEPGMLGISKIVRPNIRPRNSDLVRFDIDRL